MAGSKRSCSEVLATSGTMCELLRHDASKWTAILYLAELWGIDPEKSAPSVTTSTTSR